MINFVTLNKIDDYMKHILRVIFLIYFNFSIAQPVGEVIDQTTIDIANYCNSTTNQIFIDF